MTDKITEARRKLFEAVMHKTLELEGYASYSVESVMERGTNGKYASVRICGAWEGFNAALDSVEIELPPLNNSHVSGADSVYGPSIEQVEDAGFDYGVKACRAAIESTNLGLRVK